MAKKKERTKKNIYFKTPLPLFLLNYSVKVATFSNQQLCHLPLNNEHICADCINKQRYVQCTLTLWYIYNPPPHHHHPKYVYCPERYGVDRQVRIDVDLGYIVV